MRAMITALLNGWLDPDKAPPQQLIRHRFLVVAASFLGLVLASRSLEDLLRGDLLRGFTVLLVSMVIPLVLYVLKRTGRPEAATVGLLAAGVLLILALVVQGSHLFATTPLYVCLLPLCAGLLMGSRSAVGWGAVGMSLLAFLLLLHALELRPNPHGWQASVVRALDLGLVLFMVTGLAVTFDTVQRAVLGLLERQADELAAENQVRRQAEAAARTAEANARTAMAARTRFLASMSHELRTPLHGVIGATRLMDGSDLPPAQRELLDTARSSADLLLGLIDDVLDYARLDAGAIQFERIPLDLRALLEEAASPLRLRGRSRGVAVRVEVQPGLSIWRMGDPTRIRQIVLNLAGNALKFTERGEVRIFAAAAGDGVRIEIEDTGIGMDQAALDGIFAPFVQAEGSIARRFGGTGLGLAIVRRLVQVYAGDIEVTSTPGVGTTFAVTLPLPATAPVAPMSLEEAPARGLRVLVVDDNAVNRSLALHMVRSGGHLAESVSSGEQALAAIAAAPFDVVLMDCQMPGMDGFQTTRRLRSDGWGGVVVGLSASAQPEVRGRALAAGMNAYLTKPIAPRALLLTLGREVAKAA